MKKRGAPRRISHPLLEELDRQGLTVHQAFGRRRGQVYDWICGRRPIPRCWADQIRERFGINTCQWTRISG